MTIEELKKITSGKETLTIEFKSDVKRLPDGELVDALAAMANSQGGMLFEGVEGKVHVYFLGKAYHQEVGEEVAYTKMVGIDRIRHKEMVLEFLQHHGRIVNREAMKLCDLSRNCTYKLLDKMVRDNEIVKKGGGRWTYYTLSN